MTEEAIEGVGSRGSELQLRHKIPARSAIRFVLVHPRNVF